MTPAFPSTSASMQRATMPMGCDGQTIRYHRIVQAGAAAAAELTCAVTRLIEISSISMTKSTQRTFVLRSGRQVSPPLSLPPHIRLKGPTHASEMGMSSRSSSGRAGAVEHPCQHSVPRPLFRRLFPARGKTPAPPSHPLMHPESCFASRCSSVTSGT